MRDILAFITLLGCLTVAAFSLVALIRPLRWRILSSRRKAAQGFGLAIALFILTAIIIPQPKGMAPNSSPVAPLKVVAPQPKRSMKVVPAENKDHDNALEFAQRAAIQMVSCSSGVDFAQSRIDKAVENSPMLVDAYQAVKRAKSACSYAQNEFEMMGTSNLRPMPHRDTLKNALDYCESAAASRIKAMKLAETILNVGGDLEMVSQFRDAKTKAVSEDAICKMNLQGWLSDFGITDKETGFMSL